MLQLELTVTCARADANKVLNALPLGLVLQDSDSNPDGSNVYFSFSGDAYAITTFIAELERLGL